MKKMSFYKLIFILAATFVVLPAFSAEAVRTHGETVQFFVDPDYDMESREKLSATLRKISRNAYFYVEDEWWQEISVDERNQINRSFGELADEFDQKIYPELTDFYGSERKPGIDNDPRVTILFHQMENNAAGYFRNVDNYRKIEAPRSNEREMFYINAEFINEEIVKSYIAHEFTHLITFNQKTVKLGTEEDIWLNELRAEYAPAYLGYDDPYEDSNLEERIHIFLQNPNTSLTEWRFQRRDYGIINIFAQYLTQHYGEELLKETMAAPYTGIASFNFALARMGIDKDFSQIFAEWTIAAFLNDCTFGEYYCYKQEPLTYLRVAPSLIYLPATQQSEFSLVYAIKEWSGRWYKIVGSDNGISVEFQGLSDIDYNVAYLVERNNKIESVEYLELDEDRSGVIELPHFGQNSQSLIIIPSILNKTSGFTDSEPFWRFSLDITAKEQQEPDDDDNDYNNNDDKDVGDIVDDDKSIEDMSPEELRAKIMKIIALIAQLKQELAEEQMQQVSCSSIDKNLYYGMTNNDQVRCLQEFLKAQGSEIYPEGLVTGNFFTLTKQAVIRFQERYAPEILAPLALEQGTGNVAANTRRKINELLAG